MSITFSGLATGLDTDSIVKDLMAIERAPLERVEAKKTDATKRLEAFAQFKSKLEGLQDCCQQHVPHQPGAIDQGIPYL